MQKYIINQRKAKIKSPSMRKNNQLNQCWVAIQLNTTPANPRRRLSLHRISNSFLSNPMHWNGYKRGTLSLLVAINFCAETVCDLSQSLVVYVHHHCHSSYFSLLRIDMIIFLLFRTKIKQMTILHQAIQPPRVLSMAYKWVPFQLCSSNLDNTKPYPEHSLFGPIVGIQQ